MRQQYLFEEIMAEHFPNPGKETDIQIEGAQKIPNKMKQKRAPPKYIIFKMEKVKGDERILKAARGE